MAVLDVFDVFDQTEYTFLEIGRGGVKGNTILSEIKAMGVFKLRLGMTANDNQETGNSTATIHIKPDEPFINDGNIEGQGIRCQGNEYVILGVTGGKNFHDGRMEHYRATLQLSSFVKDRK